MTLAVADQVDFSRHPVQIAERVWWVGHVQVNDPFQCHVYLIEQGRQSVLLDPGSNLTFRHTLQKIEEIIPFSHIRYFVCHHQDPDITGALPLIDEMIGRDDAVLITHWRAQALIKHYGLRLPFWLIDQHDWQLQLEDRFLKFIFTPYAHFPGAFCTFDSHSQVLFSSDIFGGFTEKFCLVAQDEGYFEALRPFHEHYMPSREILNYALSKMEEHPIRMIAPQHGSIIPEHLVQPIINQLKALDCGLYLLARDSTDIHRLSKLNRAIHDIMNNMIVSREFRDIADGLLEILQRLLPVKHLEFYARLDNDTVLHLAPENRFRGTVASPPPSIDALLGKHLEDWADHSASHYQWVTLHKAGSETHPALQIPLFSPDRLTIHAVAIIHLDEILRLQDDIDQLIEQIVVPLQVAVEREVIYRTLDMERQRFYERSIHDQLTGLFTRFYMQDMIQRMFNINDRNEYSTVAVAMIDIDHFKRINDTFGHNQGDVVLRRVAEVIMSNVRSGDLPVRLGGEEFGIFIIGQSVENTDKFAERVRQEIARLNFDKPMEDWQVTVSIGTAIRHQGEDLKAFINRADKALYDAKNAGRNQVRMAEDLAY